MSRSLEEVRKSVAAKLQDDAQFISPDEYEQAIQDALRKVSIDDGLAVVKDIPGDGTQDLQLPSEYIGGFSAIESVEYPAGETPIAWADEDDWFFYEDPSKPAGEQMRLRFNFSQPEATEVVRVAFTTEHTLTESVSTLGPKSYLAVVFKTLVYCYRTLAAKFNQGMDPTIAADAVAYGTLSSNYLFLSERYETEYKNAIGLGSDVKAAQAMADADIRFSENQDFVWHASTER